MILITVESPTKAKALNEYLKKEDEEYKVVSTYGHIKNLEPKNGSIDKNTFDFKWISNPKWEKNKKEILSLAKAASKVIIATDLDREGEGIAWHFNEFLKENKINCPTERIVFNSVSKKAILESLSKPGKIRQELVKSYLARIGLDYLFGFLVSPVLWKKTPCCKSAGRVQSSALRLIVEKEFEIKQFQPLDYLNIFAKFKDIQKNALLIQLNDNKFEDGKIFDKNLIADKNLTKEIEGIFKIQDISKTTTKINPHPPFITSSLQQAASTRLNFSPTLTMQLAQKLYEGFSVNNKHVGLITYMRTDSIKMSDDFVQSAKEYIKKELGPEYVGNFEQKKSSTKNAQEAHEAIRPVDLYVFPALLKKEDENLYKLYKLIWERAVSSLMKESINENLNIKIAGQNSKYESLFEIKTSKMIFDGFKKFEPVEEFEEESFDISKLTLNSIIDLENIFSEEKKTTPPKRYSEASLISGLEKKGIGRPSTYAKIIQVLYDREYATKEKKIIIPTNKGWVVTAFLKNYFSNEVEYEFTSQMEELLENLEDKDYKPILQNFWENLEIKINAVKDKSPVEISQIIRKEFDVYFLNDLTKCSECSNDMVLKITKFGAIVGCSNYPNCKNIINLDQKPNTEKIEFENNIQLKSGPYGKYIEFTEMEKTKRIPVPKIWDKEEISNEKIQFLASLPLKIGEYKNEDIKISIGKFGPYAMWNKNFISIKDPMNHDLEDIIKKIEKKSKV